MPPTTRGREVRARRHERLHSALAVACIATLLVACAPPSQTDVKPVLPFIEDDYAQALSVAREKQLPMFVESWAPW